MAYKSPAQRKFLFAMDKAKQKGVSLNPPQTNMLAGQQPHILGANSNLIKPTAAPGIPKPVNAFKRIKKLIKF